MIRASDDSIASNEAACLVLQLAGRSIASDTGKVVAVSDYHALQQREDALHIIRDLSLIIPGVAGISLNVVATLAYSMPDGSASGLIAADF